MVYSEEFLQQLKEINIFLTSFYVPAWLHSSIGSDTVINSLLYLKDMSEYIEFDVQVFGTA